jgi:hypothetical protein
MLWRKLILLFLTPALFYAPTLCGAQVTPASVSIVVTDASGKPLQGAKIELNPAPNPMPQTMETDAQGQVSLSLNDGYYALQTVRVGFRDRSDKIYVQSSKTQRLQTFNIHMEAPRRPAVIRAANSNVSQDSLLVSARPFHDDVSYKLGDLQSMPRTTVTIHNAHTDADETYTGVRLSDILAPLGVPLGKDLRGSALALCVLATGSDDYHVVVALAEIDPAFHPGEVLVADTMNGKPIPAETGPFRLVVTEDKRPARAVRNLVSIELKSVN